MRSTFDFKFYCRASKANKQGLAPIEVSISVNSERRFINLPLKCSPKDFEKRRPQIKEFIHLTTCNINSYVIDMYREGIPVTADNVAEAIRNNGIRRTYTVQNLFEEYNAIIEGKDISLGQMRKYSHTTEEFYSIVDMNKPADEVSVGDITKFRNYIYGKYATNTAAGHMVRIKAYFKYAKDNNKIGIDPASRVKITRSAKTDIVHLTEEEYEALKIKDMHSERLNRVRDLWIAQANMGLSYCDLASITKEDIKEYNGILYISKDRQKTGQHFTSVILPDGIAILKKYDYNLPVLSNQRYNSYIDECINIAGINKKVTTHTARKQYATKLLKANIPMAVIQHCLGHSSLTTTEKFYAAMVEEKIITEVSKLY